MNRRVKAHVFAVVNVIKKEARCIYNHCKYILFLLCNYVIVNFFLNLISAILQPQNLNVPNFSPLGTITASFFITSLYCFPLFVN